MDLSVVMAAYNGEPFLEEAVSSILAQTYTDFEFIIVNDGSTDRTGPMLDAIRDKRVKVIHLDANRGAAVAMRIGVQAAKGRWIAVQDADDVSLPGRLEKQMNYVRLNPGVSAVSCLIECISGRVPLSPERLALEARGCNMRVTSRQILDFLYYGCPLCHGSMLFSREIYFKTGGYDPRYRIAYDYDLWLKMIEFGPIAKVDEVLYRWRVNLNSLSRSSQTVTCAEVMRASASHIPSRFRHLYRAPRFAVIGSRRAMNHFRKKAAPLTDLQVNGYYPAGKWEEACTQYKRNGVDGIIVLDHKNSGRTMRMLEAEGLILNANLFLIWNVIE